MSAPSQKSLIERLQTAGILDGNVFDSRRGRFCDAALKNDVIAWAVARNPSLAHQDTKFAEIVYWLVHNLSAYPKLCAVCSAPITHFHSSPLGYTRDYCSKRCTQLSSEVRDKIGDTLEAKHGVRHQMHAATTKEKISVTNMERYGVANVFEAEAIKDRSRETLINRYGTDNVSKLPDIKEQKLKTRNGHINDINQNVGKIIPDAID